MTTQPRLLLATGNKAKIGEYRALLGHLPFEIRTPSEEGLDIEVEETGSTMQENVSLKALAYARISGLVSLADDSGLEVDALGGEPGVMSARYAGEGASDRERVAFLLARLEGVPWGKRKARFRCVIGVATPEGGIELCEDTCPGIITFEPRGEQGFGYDPVFRLPRLDRCMAELTLEEKNRVSHRGRAARRAEVILRRMRRDGILK